MPAEMVTLQLWRDKRRIGDKFTAHVDWQQSPELRRYLLDAVHRAGFPRNRVGEFRLEVRDGRDRKHLTEFAATYDERRDR